MPSRAESRYSLEMVLRAIIVATLAYALWQSIAGARGQRSSLSVTTNGVDRAVQRALAEQGINRIDLTLAENLSSRQRDALVALRRAGVDVRWAGAVAPIAAEVVRDRDPQGGAEIRVVGIAAGSLVSDSAGVLDTLRSASAATLDVGTLVGHARIASGSTAATVGVPDASERKAVLILGRADWESKFVMSALSEAGWSVRARIPAAPGVDVRDDALLPIDTSRYDAIVALDTSAADFAPAIVRFVQQGGGLVLSGAALQLASLRAVGPSSAAARIPGRILLAEDTVTRRDLPITPLQNLRADAVSLERQPTGVALAARRAGLGRVLALGYDESWRWRMLGGESGLDAHRQWWSRAVASVTAERADSVASGIAAAPRVAMMRSLGAPSALEGTSTLASPSTLSLWMLLLVVMAALAEIASRRLRGER
jgi:hypothetical protein